MKGALMTVADKILVRKRAIIESVNDERTSLQDFLPIASSPQKPMIALDRCNTIDAYNQLTLF